MELCVKTFPELSTAELYAIAQARVAVFVVEQQCPYQELDGRDDGALHLWYHEGGAVRAYLRLFLREDEEGVAQISRVLTTARGTGLGAAILEQGLEAARTRLGAREVFLEAQSYARGFYERAGFRRTTEEFLEDGIPHIGMRKLL